MIRSPTPCDNYSTLFQVNHITWTEGGFRDSHLGDLISESCMEDQLDSPKLYNQPNPGILI